MGQSANDKSNQTKENLTVNYWRFANGKVNECRVHLKISPWNPCGQQRGEY